MGTSPNENYRISPAGLDLIKKYEGWYPKAYQDPVGVWTIGWGTIGPEAVPGRIITKEQGTKFLQDELKEVEGYVKNLVKVPLNQFQFDALCSFVYNVGPGNLQKSTLLVLLNRSNYPGAAAQFTRYVNARDRRTGVWKKLPGLVKRRNEEMELFLRMPEPEEDVLSNDVLPGHEAPVYIDGSVQADGATHNKGALWDVVAYSQTFRTQLLALGGFFTTLSQTFGKLGENPVIMFGLGMMLAGIAASLYVKWRDTREGR